MSSPTSRSLDLLRKEGFVPAVVERWNTFAGPPDKKCKECGKNQVGVRQDLFGFADIIAINPQSKVVVLVQTTSGSNMSARRRKMAGIGEVLLCMTVGFKIEIHGWSKRANGRYEVNRETLNP
jgi:hypothetical protein